MNHCDPSDKVITAARAESELAEQDLLACYIFNDRDPRILFETFTLGLHPMHWSDRDACHLFYELSANNEHNLHKTAGGISHGIPPAPESPPWDRPLDAFLSRISKGDCDWLFDPRWLPEGDADECPYASEVWRQEISEWVATIRRASAIRYLQEIKELCENHHKVEGTGCLDIIRHKVDEWRWSPLWAKRAVSQLAAGTLPIPQYRTGIKALDEHLGPLQPGQLVVLVSRPHTGKRDILLQMLLNQPDDDNDTGAVIQFHSIGKQEIALRMQLQAMRTGLPVRRIRSGNLTVPEQAALTEVQAGLDGLPVIWHCGGAQSVVNIAHATQATQRTGRRPLVVVDYLQMLNSDVMVHSESYIATQVLQQLKFMARDHGVPLIVSIQMDNLLFSNTRAPGIPEIRAQSLGIEQQADTLITLPCCSLREDISAPYPIEVRILKNLFGADGNVTLYRCPLTGTINS